MYNLSQDQLENLLALAYHAGKYDAENPNASQHYHVSENDVSDLLHKARVRENKLGGYSSLKAHDSLNKPY